MGKPTLLVSLVAMLCINALAQQNPSGSTATDSFIGKWKLNVDRSSTQIAAGTITIEPVGKKYRITLDFANTAWFGGAVWTVTDMKGWASPVTRNSNHPIGEEWHVKREGVDSFTIISVFRVPGAGGRVEYRYTVGPDGKTLTRRVISEEPPGHRQVLVFEKAP